MATVWMAGSEGLKKEGKGEGLTSRAPPQSSKEGKDGGSVSDEIVCPSA